MKFESAFNIGDKVYVFDGAFVQELTVGQIRITATDYHHVRDGKPEYEEDYMCEETGVGSGIVYTLGKHIFANQEECKLAFTAEMEERRKEKEEQHIREQNDLLREETYLRSKLAKIETIKAERISK